MIEIRADYGQLSGVYLGLVLFGLGYNALVAWLERKHYTEGFLSLIVALGVFVTLLGVFILSIEAALLTLGAFVATGIPMIVGSIIRYVQRRESNKAAMRDELK